MCMVDEVSGVGCMHDGDEDSFEYYYLLLGFFLPNYPFRSYLPEFWQPSAPQSCPLRAGCSITSTQPGP